MAELHGLKKCGVILTTYKSWDDFSKQKSKPVAPDLSLGLPSTRNLCNFRRCWESELENPIVDNGCPGGPQNP